MIYENENASIEIEAVENEAKTESKNLSIHPKTFQNKYLVSHMESKLWDLGLKELIENDKAVEALAIVASSDAQLYVADYKISSLIKAMGTDGEQDLKMNLYRGLHKMDNDIKVIIINKDGLKIEKTDGTSIRSRVLSDVMPHLFRYNPTIKTKQRSKAVPYNTIDTATKLFGDCQVVSGFTYGLTSKSRYLSCWIETVLDNEDVVIDLSMNAIVNKNGFYELKKAEPVAKISKDLLKKDGQIVYPYIEKGELSYSEYLFCRQEVLESISELESEK